MAASVADLILSTITTLEGGLGYYNVVKDDSGLREAFHEAGRGLLLVSHPLQAAQRTSVRDPQSAMVSLKKCNSNGELVKSIFNAVAQAPETSRFEAYKEAVRQEGKGRTVEDLVVAMMQDVYALAENFAIQDKVKGLHEAIEKLLNMEPSLPKGSGGDIYTHYGSGDMYNTFGGTVNRSAGTGNHFPGANFAGSVSFGLPSPQNPPSETSNK
ncbi:hypothetical protein CSAL01_04546 [Colletotrichum salicis]|uniref:NACHT-NTPase and P-loop NTPases N-terminal domain-containing protein n=1 Tax=Colletotrichum salicis TaxID=1209931 RepID=A0A135USW5_9PEZI|nr:hypothetical protein CSAL01_04546 [Colletotrichum salicis]